MKSFSFDITARDTSTAARCGVIHTPHGDIETPAFVPVGTQATVKSLTEEDLRGLDVELFFVNTYHMYLRPGIDIVEQHGGLHSFAGWDRPLITDSGGFQVFSLGRRNPSDAEGDGSPMVRINEDGVRFQSHWDGSHHTFNAESSMEHQWRLGADIHIAFDDCTPYPVTHETARTSMERTHRWALRSVDAHHSLWNHHKKQGKPYQALYAAVQGSVYEDLRRQSAEFSVGLHVDGFAIGGVSVGETKDEMKHVLSWVTPLLPDEKPRHLLGVGEIDDVFALVEAGMDTFDCVQPTRLARMGQMFSVDGESHGANATTTRRMMIDITKSSFAHDRAPIDRRCMCYVCKTYTRAYIHHLFRVRELLAYRLATYHNVYFMQDLVRQIRTAIRDNTFIELQKQWMIR